jgi:hypothetical protein
VNWVAECCFLRQSRSLKMPLFLPLLLASDAAAMRPFLWSDLTGCFDKLPTSKSLDLYSFFPIGSFLLYGFFYSFISLFLIGAFSHSCSPLRSFLFYSLIHSGHRALCEYTRLKWILVDISPRVV